MGFFDFFKKKSKKVKHELSQEDLKWNKMWDLWAKDEIESPFAELMEYLSGINGEGHFGHFDNISGNQELDKYVEQLILILPEPLKSNVKLAYDTYIINPDDISEENADILDNCDSVYYKNEEIVNDILKQRASKIDL